MHCVAITDIKHLIDTHMPQPGVIETGIKGVKLFRVTEPISCTPAVYEPCIIAIVNGSKEAIFDGHHYEYDTSQYMCCSMSIPIEAGTPKASPDNPLLGVSVSLDTQAMTELTVELESAFPTKRAQDHGRSGGFALADWDASFSEALYRLLCLLDRPTDQAVLAQGRLREFYYAVFQGDAGAVARRAFGIGNEIARTIEYLSTRLDDTVSIDEMANRVGMSRAVFHRKFKQATAMSPVQYVKSMRLNHAAMKIASGMTVNEAALEVGYISPSQFSREFKRQYGLSPRQWGHENRVPVALGQHVVASRHPALTV